MTKETEAAIIAAIQNAPDEAWLAAMDAMDRDIARSTSGAWRPNAAQKRITNKKENEMETDIIKMGVDDAKEIANLVASGSLWTETIEGFSRQITRVNEETRMLGVDTPVGTAVFCSRFSIIESLVWWILLTAKEAVMKDTKQRESK